MKGSRRQECNFIIKLLTDDWMMCYLLQGAKEVEHRGRMNLIQDIFYNPIYPSSQSVLPGGVIMPGMKIFGRTLMLIGGLQNYRHGTRYNLLPAVRSCGLSSWARYWGGFEFYYCIRSFVSSVDNAGRNICVVGQSRSRCSPETGINVYLSTFNIW